MRDTDERMAAVNNQIAAMEKESRLRRSRWIAGVSLAVCLLLVVGLSLSMPAWSGKVASVESGDLGVAASLLSGSSVLGYIVIGILAFLLGATMTILCFHLKKWAQNGSDNKT